MKMSIATIAIALVYLMSIVMANHLTSDQDDQTMGMASGLRGHGTVGAVTNTINAPGNNVLVTNSNILLPKSDRVQLAKTIKEMLMNNPEASAASAMTTEDLFGLLTRIATTPGVLSNAAGIISAARSGNTGALAGHVVGLLGAAIPAAVPIPTPAVMVTPAPIVAPIVPVVAPIASPATPSIPIAPIYASSPMSAVAPATIST